jgi:hypothetical protein
MKNTKIFLLVTVIATVILPALGGCASTSKIPWNFLSKEVTRLEGSWLENTYSGSFAFNFSNSTYIQFRTGKNENPVPFLRGVFRILDGNLELLMMSFNNNLLNGLQYDAAPVWVNKSLGRGGVTEYTAPTHIYSMDKKDVTMVLELIGGTFYTTEKKDGLIRPIKLIGQLDQLSVAELIAKADSYFDNNDSYVALTLYMNAVDREDITINQSAWALYHIALIYERNRMPTTALEWYTRAAFDGSTEAMDILKERGVIK